MKPGIPTKAVVGAGGRTLLPTDRRHVVDPLKSAVAWRMTQRRRRNLRSPAFAFSRGKLESSPILYRIRDNDIVFFDLRELNAEKRSMVLQFLGTSARFQLDNMLFLE